GFVPPIAEYAHVGDRCSITGGYVYRGHASTLPEGSYLFGDFCSGELLLLSGGVQPVLLDTPLLISSFGEDEAGELYVVDLTGTVYRMVNPEGPPTTGPDLVGTWSPVSQICRRGRCRLMGAVRVSNQGNMMSPASRLRVILSNDAGLDAGDTVLREMIIRRLRVGLGQTRPVNVLLPIGVNISGKFLFAVIDALNNAPETDETNNTPMIGPIP
ncbi:MAG: hypothetical protein FIA90_12085, partial [candidate division NC10 bacterium]|nr:hypothetical protein [candidate division NC10 bacterium]